MNQLEAFARMQLRFTADDAQCAGDTWGANCGPGAIAAVAGLSLTELRPHLRDFELKGYMNPLLMWQVLQNLSLSFKVSIRRHDSQALDWPHFGLARIQWEGPWTRPGVPARAAYRHTHWVAAMRIEGEADPAIFDINAIQSGGWIRLAAWRDMLVPWLLQQCEPKGTGGWFLTHSVEIRSASSAGGRGMSQPFFDPETLHGISFFDAASKRKMRYIYPDAGHWCAGWIIVQNPSGQWMTLRKATDADIAALNCGVAEAHHA